MLGTPAHIPNLQDQSLSENDTFTYACNVKAYV